MNSSFQQLLPLLFPSELLEAFDITDVQLVKNARNTDETAHLFLVERNAPPIIPAEHRGKRIVSKGFNHPLLIHDFPLRSRPCILHIKTRRWEIQGAGSLTRTLSFLPREGLKLTTDFAAFLKAADRTGTGGD